MDDRWSGRRITAAVALPIEVGLLAAASWFHALMWHQMRSYYRRDGIYFFRIEPSLHGQRVILGGAIICALVVLALRPPRLIAAGQGLALALACIAGYSSGVLRPGPTVFVGPSRLPWAAVLFLVACLLAVACFLQVRPQRAARPSAA